MSGPRAFDALSLAGGQVDDRAIARAVAAAQAAAEKLPTTTPLNAGSPVTDPAATALPPNAVTAVHARLGFGAGAVTIVVPAEVTEALKNSPLGELDPTLALQPAIDAAAEVLGGRAEPGEAFEPALGLETLATKGVYVAVPLLAGGAAHALVAVALPPTKPAATTGSVVTDVSGFRPHQGIDLLRDVAMEVTVELGRTRMTVRELLSLAPGAIIELDRVAGSPADVLVNGTLIARGEVVVVEEDFGIRVTEIVTRAIAENGS